MPAVRVKFRLDSHKDIALKSAPRILQKNLSAGMEALGKRLVASAQTRMRKDTGREQKSLRYRVTQRGLNINLLVFSTLVQAFVDAYGMRRGVFPDFKVNSKLYNWVKRRSHGFPTKQVKTVGTPTGPRKSVARRRIAKIKKVKRVVGSQAPLTTQRRLRAKNTDIRRLAFLVARAIFRRGREASDWTGKTLEANRARIIRELQNALARSVNEIKRA